MGETNAINAGDQPPARTVLCIGDIHGYFSKLQSLWFNLEAAVGTAAFQTALVIFLGDYCDRGPQTREVLEFLLSLSSRYPNQSHVFLCGNHDFAFAAFVGALPPPPDGSPFSATWAEFELNKDREGWFEGEGYEFMHVQGRRWGGFIRDKWNPTKNMAYKGSIYDGESTFKSYGVAHGSPDLVKAVPDHHKKFLASLVWVHEEELTKEPTIVVSGHHGKLHIDGLRLVIDEGGGIEQNPIAAIVLPSMKIVRDTDNMLV
ncbi:hypothetical protein KFK09_023161 [Dendrobium nobile]|uniref:Calcineurin-like phosphoesterase domain-containing protein n=1 Tax=Dendrobium nobile TaxID=94219 RepID=A0A8T3AKP9_DENNO|nr:hypothetical protein KFK09_023161 [Dendrobium nobile]